jgi:hypothetical protein
MKFEYVYLDMAIIKWIKDSQSDFIAKRGVNVCLQVKDSKDLLV